MPLCPDAHADLTLRRCRVETLELSRFRNFLSLRLSFDERPVVLHGPNGSGKTNLLEALSCLAAGRGLRRARIRDLDYDPGHDPGHEPAGIGTPSSAEAEGRGGDRGGIEGGSRGGWRVRSRLTTLEGLHEIESAHVLSPTGRDRRRITIDGAAAQSLAPMLWMTPENEALGADPASTRRRFFDRLVSLFDPDHRGRCAMFERQWREREKILEGRITMARKDRDSWCESIEENLAGLAVAITAARRALLGPLDDLCRRESAFPAARLSLSGPIEDRLQEGSALAAEEYLRAELAEGRQAGRGGIGPQRSVLSIRRADGASHASTGQEKALALRLLCAAAALFARRNGVMPILLIDETLAHFDATMREGLLEHLADLDAQIWMSGADPHSFASWGDRAQFFRVGDRSLRPSPPPPADRRGDGGGHQRNRR